MNRNSTPPEGLCARVAASGGESEARDPEAANAPQAGTGSLDPRALILDTISTAINRAGFWLAIEGRRAIADAVHASQEREIQAWRHKAIQRAIALGRAERALNAVRELTAEEVTDTSAWGDGYREALRDLAELLTAFAPKEQQ